MSDYFAGDHTQSGEPPHKQPGKPKRVKLPDYLGLGFKTTWPVHVVTLACIVVFGLQVFQVISLYDHAFSAQAMKEGRYGTLFTSLFLHGGLAHVGFNMWAYVSLATMVYRRFGKGLTTLAGFLAFYILTGMAGNLVFWGLHPMSDVPVVGASGAIYGLFGGAVRLNPFSDKPEGLFSRAVLRGWWYFFLSNLLVVVIAGGPMVLLQLAGGQPVQDLFIPIAWEAHLGGFVAGLLLIGPMTGKGWDATWKSGMLQRLEAMRSAETSGHS